MPPEVVASRDSRSFLKIAPDRVFSKDEVEQLITQEMKELSLDEQTKIAHDIHGIPELRTSAPAAVECEEEPPEFLAEKLAAMEDALQHKIADKHKEIYNMALEIDSDYVTDPDYRLMFLRTEDFDSQLAALRLVRHLEMKLDLFGKELLCQDISQDDLEDTSLEVLYGGSVQLLPKRDTKGRLIVVMYLKEQPEDIEDAHLHLLRRNYYIGMLGSREAQNQRAGRVVVAFPSKSSTLTPTAAFRAAYYNGQCMPFKTCALHFCVEPNQSRLFSSVMATSAVAVDRMSRARFRFHIMAETELLYTLLTHGIPVDCLSFTRDTHIAMLRQARVLEQQEAMARDVMAVASSWRATDSHFEETDYSSSPIIQPRLIDFPTHDDVLVARDFPNSEAWHYFWAGNKRFRAVIEAARHQLVQQGAELNDEEVVDAVVPAIQQSVHNTGGRFLREIANEGTAAWIEMDAVAVGNVVIQSVQYGIPEPDIEEKKSSCMETSVRTKDDGDLFFSADAPKNLALSPNETQIPVPKISPPTKLKALADIMLPTDTSSCKEPLTGTVVMFPSNSDVLLGKGKRCQNHQGNLRFRYLVDEYREEYDAADSNDKRKKINIRVLQIVKSKMNGRFLREIKDAETGATAGWVEVDDAKARDKIAMCFRSKRRIARKETREDVPLTAMDVSSKRSAECGCNPFEPSGKRSPNTT